MTGRKYEGTVTVSAACAGCGTTDENQYDDILPGNLTTVIEEWGWGWGDDMELLCGDCLAAEGEDA